MCRVPQSPPLLLSPDFGLSGLRVSWEREGEGERKDNADACRLPCLLPDHTICANRLTAYRLPADQSALHHF